MARKRPQYKLAAVGLSEGDRNVLVSAINSCASALEGEFSWSEPEAADIHIVDVVNQGTYDLPVVVRYTARKNGQPVDLWRPIRTQILIDALNKAGARAAEQSKPSQAVGTSTKRYRGAVVESAPASPNSASQNPRDAAPKTRRPVIYRGHRIE